MREQNIFVVNAPNAVTFDMQLAESIPQGVTELFCHILKCDFIKLFLFRARKTFLMIHVRMSLYKHCILQICVVLWENQSHGQNITVRDGQTRVVNVHNSPLLQDRKDPVTTINHSEYMHHYRQYNVQQYHVSRSISAHST